MKRAVPTVVYTFGGGRLGNQLVRFSHWLAWAAEHQGEVQIINAGFWPHADDFTRWHGAPECGYPADVCWAGLLSRLLKFPPARFSGRIEQRVLHMLQAAGGWMPGWQRIGQISQLAEVDLGGTRFLETVARARVTTCAGWRIASWDLVAKHGGLIRQLLAPRGEIVARARDSVDGIRSGADLVVGVLIRQGDYRQWSAGRFFFEAVHYAKYMRRLVELHSGRMVAFLVTSDEFQDPRVFDGLNVTFAIGSVNRGGRAIDALFELAACDAIIAPPSTFAAWASHWGRVPWWPVGENPDGAADWRPVAGDLEQARRDPWLSAVVA